MAKYLCINTHFVAAIGRITSLVTPCDVLRTRLYGVLLYRCNTHQIVHIHTYIHTHQTVHIQSNLVSEYTWGPSKLLLTISSTCKPYRLVLWVISWGITSLYFLTRYYSLTVFLLTRFYCTYEHTPNSTHTYIYVYTPNSTHNL